MGEAERKAIVWGVRTVLILPLLRNDELIGTLSLARRRIEPFMEKEIELVTDFAAQAAIALANDVERVFADIDADYGGRSVEFL